VRIRSHGRRFRRQEKKEKSNGQGSTSRIQIIIPEVVEEVSILTGRN